MNILIFLGSARLSTPPSPKRVGERVSIYLKSLVEKANHNVEVIDPIDLELTPIFKPHFSYGISNVPKDLEALSEKIKSADAYIMLTPEYNHSMSPALAHLLNHFGSSSYSYKPSLICTYSQGQWGGARAAMGMRNFLGELGCISVSAMLHIPKAHQVFNEDGTITDDISKVRWESYFQHGLKQLYWWADACIDQRKTNNPHDSIESFKKTPDQRNSPT